MRFTRSIVPNLFTLVNLFMGFTAIIYIAKDEFDKAALCILIAAIFDMLDGVVARLFKSASEFGVELDSLCDAVSFGVAPAYLLYKVYFFQFNELGILFASFPALAGIVRLARFNVMLSSFEDKKYFTGLAIPSGAFVIIAYVIFYHLRNEVPIAISDYAMFTLSIGTSLLMVSKIKFKNIPRPTPKSFKENPLFFSIFIVGIILCIITKGKFIFPFMLLYIIGSSIIHFIKWIKTTREAADDLEET